MGLVLNSDDRHFLRQNRDSIHPLRKKDKEFAQRRSLIVDRVMLSLGNYSAISIASLETLVKKLNIGDKIFLRYFEDISELDVEIRRRTWNDLLSKLRRVAIDGSGNDVVLQIAKTYHHFAREKKPLFEYVICTSRYSYEGAKYFDQFAYLLRIVLLSCNVEIRQCEQMANNLIDVIHGLALLEIEQTDNRLVKASTDDLLKKYISQIFNRQLSVAN